MSNDIDKCKETVLRQLGLGDMDPYDHRKEGERREKPRGRGLVNGKPIHEWQVTDYGLVGGKKDEECPDCFGTGLLGGFSVPCPRGCGRNEK